MPREIPRPSAPSLLEVLPWGDPAADRRRLLRAVGAALLVHAALFLVVWPGGPSPLPVRVPQARPFVVHTLRPRTPEPPPPTPSLSSVEQPTVVVPAPPEASPEPVADASPVTAPPQPSPAALDPGFEIPLTAPPPPAPAPRAFDPGSMQAPVRLYAPTPAYTEAARRIRKQGDVIVEAVIDADGRVRDARILRSLGFGLDESTLRALGEWRFEPARKAGRPIPVIYTLVVRFRLS